MSAIGPGDWVECVRASVGQGGPFRIGSIYRVTKVIGPARCPRHEQCFGICVAEMPRSSHPTGAYSGCCFRPIYRPKADLIESLLQGIDQLVPDDGERANARLSSPSPIAGCNPLEKASFIEASGARSGSFKQFRAPEITNRIHLFNLLSPRSSAT